MLYVYACISRSRLCHALCPPPVGLFLCGYIHPPHGYWGVTTCEMHPCDANLLDAYLFSALCDVACHACFVPPVWLSLLLCILFACLLTCSCISLCLPLSLSLIPTILCRFTPVFDTWDPKSFLGILLYSTCCPYSNLKELWTLDPNLHLSS